MYISLDSWMMAFCAFFQQLPSLFRQRHKKKFAAHQLESQLGISIKDLEASLEISIYSPKYGSTIPKMFYCKYQSFSKILFLIFFEYLKYIACLGACT